MKSDVGVRPHFSRLLTLSSVSTAALSSALLCSSAAFAQSTEQPKSPPATESASPDAQPDAASKDIVVTGTNIIRDGYRAPTPLTVVGEDLLKQGGSADIADRLASIPAFAGNLVSSANRGVGQGTNGMNGLNLRNLGLARTLVLIDGQRSVASHVTGVVDINTIPQQLVKRVEIVTGGASAVYGSDAVAGVANFILDRKFTGFKAEVSQGITIYGDDPTTDVALTGGFNFGGGRGHLIVSGSLSREAGIWTADRDWDTTGLGQMTNPTYTATNGQPQLVVREQVSLNNATPGGIIVSGPLKGTYFGEGGKVLQFNYGSFVSGSLQSGGDWAVASVRALNGPSLEDRDQRYNGYTRMSFDITDHVNLYGSASWARANSFSLATPTFYLGNFPLITTGNVFIPASVQTQMTALGLQTLQLGTYVFDIQGNDHTKSFGARAKRTVTRYVAGLTGDIGTFKWDVYYQRGHTDMVFNSERVPQKSRLALALDAIANPAVGGVTGVPAGAPICRSTLTNPTNGCVPFNPFGTGVNGPGAISYLFTANGGKSQLDQFLTQNVFSGKISGEPFSIWAGPVSIALSAEHRKEAGRGVVDAVTAAKDWFAGNYAPTNGSYSVTEGALETVIPIWRDKLDVNAAVRFTDYSTSGRVTTWKVGATFTPIEDINFRGTLSRDIRAPNLQELYQEEAASSQSTLQDRFLNTTPQAYTLTSGNTALSPEIAKNITLGTIFRPRFLPGFSASVDYWSIALRGAIQFVGAQQAIDLCFQGNQTYCPYIIRTNGVITGVRSKPINIAKQTARGIDIDLTYQLPASDIFGGNAPGTLSFKAIGTRNLKNITVSGISGSVPVDTLGTLAGAGATPNWRLLATLGYNSSDFTASLTARAISSGVYNKSYIECTAGCPTSTINNMTIDDNHIDGAVFFDLSMNYKFKIKSTKTELFLNVKNLLNSDPPAVPATFGGGSISYS